MQLRDEYPMMEPLLTLIVPTHPGSGSPRALDGLDQIAQALGPLEVIVTRGRAPAQQRNHAAAKARGAVLYFLDDDCRVSPETLRRGLAFLDSGDAAAIGGPAVTLSQASFLEECCGLAISSPLGTLHMRARATPVGTLRRVGGEELIMCNLMIKKSWYLHVDGLNGGLYPGEERDFWRRLVERGAALYYDPDMIIERGRRRTLRSFISQHFRYGQARGHQFTRAEWFFGIPTMFVIYLVALGLCPHRTPGLPLELYLMLSTLAGILIASRSRSLTRGLCSALLFPVMHVAYGLGMLTGWLGARPPVWPAPPDLEFRHYGF